MRLVAILASVLLAAAGAFWVYLHNKDLVARKYENWRYPAIQEKSELSLDLNREIELRRYKEIARRYKRVEAQLEKAEGEGENVEWLKRKMPGVARLLREEKYYFARIHLNTIEVRIPRKAEKVRLASDRDHNEKIAPDIKGSEKKDRERRRTRTRKERSSNKKRKQTQWDD